MQPTPDAPLRLHRNQGGYCGERIAIGPILEQVRQAARAAGWDVHELIQQGDFPVWRMEKPVVNSNCASRRVYISAGLHGDEPAGPLAALRLLQENRWPEDVAVSLFPCLNPAGIEQNQREGIEGVDLNRDYRNPRTPLVQAHLRWLAQQPDYEAALLLHEDWEADGFYLYELAADPGLSRVNSIMRAVSVECPILQASRADDWPTKHGIVRPKVDPAHRPDWPEALYLFEEKTDLSYTFEAPSDYPLQLRVAALVAAVNSTIQQGPHETR